MKRVVLAYDSPQIEGQREEPMTSEEFVKAVKRQTADAATEGTINALKSPPGRKPKERLLRMSGWYNRLSASDQAALGEVLREAAEMAVFEFFCVLDGVSAIEDTGSKGELELYFEKDGQTVQLNDPRKEELHNLFNSLCSIAPESQTQRSETSPYDLGSAADLRSKLKSGDGLDVHHVPDKYASLQTVENYDSARGPAVVLPKSEHRQIEPE
jgi:hypothetical protein